ncbi:MAG: helix-hairpin-helix domain-containing protein [Rikenellaceae bacterium]
MFSNQQKRGVLYILLLLLVVILCVDMAQKRSTERDISTPIGDTIIEPESDSIHLFEFDPNVATLKDLRSLGLSKREALSIIRYRSAGKVFRIKEDIAGCYNISDSLYYAIEPYIVIGEEYRYKASSTPKSDVEINTLESRATTPLSKFLIDTVSAEYLHSTGVLSLRQAEVLVEWHRRSRIESMDELRECYTVSNSAASQLEQYVIFPTREQKEPKGLVDINKADSAELRSVYGIGEKSVVAIIEYRKNLGGFYSCDQISELEVVTESNFEKIITQISCDSCDISKIDVNFAVAKNLIEHPYISRKALRRLLKTRQIKGGWSSIVEMTEDDIFTLEEAERLRPYLWFDEYTKLQE